MDLDELRTVRRTERERDSLQSLRDSFYGDVAAYLEELTDRRDRAAREAEDPFGSEEVRRLTDEIETAEEIAEAVYERRVGKVVKLASLAAADMGVETDGMTDEEQDLFEDLVARIRRNKSSVLEVLAGDADADVHADGDASGTASAGEQDDTAEATAVAGADGVLAEAMGGASGTTDASGEEPPAAGEDGAAAPEPDGGATEPADGATPAGAATPPDGDSGGRTPVAPERGAPGGAPAGADGEPAGDAGPTAGTESATGGPSTGGGDTDTDRTTVRITDDVGAILGADEREYDLEREDVVTLPAANAGPLLERGAAEKLD